MSVHRINLRGPWDYEWLTPADDSLPGTFSKAGTVSMPQDWQTLFGGASGHARFQRKFHRPTNLEPHERVFIVMTASRGSGTIRLNETLIGEFEADGTELSFEVTNALDRFNVLTIELVYSPKEEPAQSGGLYGIVAIEIQNERG